MVRVLFLIQLRLHAMFSAISNNPRWRALARLKSVLPFQEEKGFTNDAYSILRSLFLMKTSLLQRILKLDALHKEFGRNTRRLGRQQSIDWCDRDMLQMEDAEFLANVRLSQPAFAMLLVENVLLLGSLCKATHAHIRFTV